MYRIKNYILILTLIIPFITLSQTKEETAYLLFNINSNDKCKVAVEGKGYLNLNKYRRTNQEKFDMFYICDLKFRFNKSSKSDTCSIKSLNNLKIVDIEYIKRKKSETILKYNPFKKVVLIEIISSSKIIKYDVKWIDDRVIIED